MAAQKHTHTATNRYPGIFRTVQEWFSQTRLDDSPPLRILSFGCSSGEEMMTLRSYFPDAVIVGCDTNIEMLRRSKRVLRGDNGLTFFSTPENVDAFGPYDVVFAMSVLCQFPDSRKVENLAKIFPFSLFSKLANNIAKNISPGGVFCLFSGNYLFRDLNVSNEFVTLRSQMIHTNGFIDRFAPDGSRLTTSVGNRDGFYQLPINGSGLTDDDLIDCLHVRKSGDIHSNVTVSVSVKDPPLGWSKNSGIAPLDSAVRMDQPSSAISSHLHLVHGTSSTGVEWTRCAWQKDRIDGDVLNFEPWYVPSDPLHKNKLTAEQMQAIQQTHQKIRKSRTLSNRILSKLKLN